MVVGARQLAVDGRKDRSGRNDVEKREACDDVRRQLRPRGLDEAARKRVVTAAKKELGKPYDARYRWDDERLYCSELVVKAFARGAGLSVGKQEVVKTLELSDEELVLAAKLGVSPLQTLVTPGSLVDDESFELIAEKVKTLK